MSKRILVTGSRDWDDRKVIAEALVNAGAILYDGEPITLVHGACPTGADQIADEWASEQGLPIERHPADWSAGRKAGPLRNQQMVNLGADVCLAFIKNNSRGAAHCSTAARKAGIPVLIYTMDAEGSVNAVWADLSAGLVDQSANAVFERELGLSLQVGRSVNATDNNTGEEPWD